MPQAKADQRTKLTGYLEIIERSGKINAIFELELPEAELIFPILPAPVQPPSDLSVSVRAVYARAGKPNHFYVLTYENIVEFHSDFKETHNATDSDAGFAEMEPRLERVELYMRNVLADKGTPRLVFWIPDDVVAKPQEIFW